MMGKNLKIHWTVNIISAILSISGNFIFDKLKN